MLRRGKIPRACLRDNSTADAICRHYLLIGADFVNRRTFLTSAAVALAARRLPISLWTDPAHAEERAWRHGLSLFGELKYPPGFKQFDYVNADAPKGGAVRQIAIGTYDNFNLVVAGVKGTLATGVDFIYDTLLVSALDEVSAEYGLLAEAVNYPDDFSAASYRLRQEAKWPDGRPITPEDAIFSFEAFKQHSPQFAAYYRHVAKVEKTGDREITFTFNSPGNRELPQIVGQLTVLPKHWWQGTDKNGNKRDIGATTLEPPLGSGAYRIKEFSPGRNIVYERVKNYWGRDLNVNVGRDNFDELRFEYFRDTTVALEAFKADTVDWRTENSAKNWATAYNFPAVGEKRVILEEFPINNIGVMQAFAFNIRRAKFQDPRVRLAFNYAFDFEEMNKQIFFGQYKRIASYFEGTELASSGVPAGRELEILETVRDKVPPELFTTPYSNPVGGNPQAVRANLREAVRLFKEAGYEVRNEQTRQQQDRRALYGRIPRRRSELRARVFILQAFARSARHHRRGAHRRRCAIREPTAQLGFRHHHRVLGGIAVARQRAARLLGLAGGRSAGLAQLDRHQEPGGRRHDRPGHLRQEPRRSCRRHPRARPRALVEPLRRAAVDLRQSAHRPLGPLRPSRSTAEIRHVGVPDRLVVGRGKGGEDRKPAVRRA